MSNKQELLTEKEQEFLKDICKWYDVKEFWLCENDNSINFENKDRTQDYIVMAEIPKDLEFKSLERNKIIELEKIILQSETDKRYRSQVGRNKGKHSKETRMQQVEDEVTLFVIGIIVGVWITLIIFISLFFEKQNELNQLKQENEKLTSIIVELNKE